MAQSEAQPVGGAQTANATILDRIISEGNMARDVSAFLVWAGDPNLETRHKYGFFAVIFLLISSFLAYGAYRNVWRDVKH